MKKYMCLIFAGMLLLLCAACQPTPEKEPVVNQRDGQLESVVAASPIPQEKDASDTTVSAEGNTLSSFIDATWVDSFTYEDLVIEVNASFEVGDGTTCPVKRATKKAIDPD